jgi:hydrogenase nickel incorporation protein HypA/HybF
LKETGPGGGFPLPRARFSCYGPRQMHELSLMTTLLQDAAAAADGARICSLRVRVGPLSGVVLEALRFAFEALTPGTPAEGARLDVEQTAPSFRCPACSAIYETPVGDYNCPSCGNSCGELIGGHELQLISIEVPDHV